MIRCNFSVVEDIVKIDETNYNYISDPTDFFTLTFNGENIYTISGESFVTLYGKLLICWMDGIHTFYVILKPNKLIQIDSYDYKLCKYLTDYSDMIRELDNIDDVSTFAYL